MELTPWSGVNSSHGSTLHGVNSSQGTEGSTLASCMVKLIMCCCDSAVNLATRLELSQWGCD